jgi:hypothetical protein
LGSVVPRSNASVVLIGTPERSDSTLRDQPIKDARELCRHWHQLAATYNERRVFGFRHVGDRGVADVMSCHCRCRAGASRLAASDGWDSRCWLKLAACCPLARVLIVLAIR